MPGGRLGSRLAPVVATVALAAAAGCGGDGRTEEDRVADAVEAMQRSLAAGELGKVCAAMGRRPQVEIGSVGHRRRPTTCEADLRAFLQSDAQAAAADGERRELARARRPRVTRVEIGAGGDTAAVVMRLGGGDPFRVPLVEEDGRWKLADFFGATGPTPKALR